MIVADAAFEFTVALVVVFFVAFPLLAHGLIGLAIGQVLGERQENQAYRRGEGVGPSQG